MFIRLGAGVAVRLDADIAVLSTALLHGNSSSLHFLEIMRSSSTANISCEKQMEELAQMSRRREHPGVSLGDCRCYICTRAETTCILYAWRK